MFLAVLVSCVDRRRLLAWRLIDSILEGSSRFFVSCGGRSDRAERYETSVVSTSRVIAAGVMNCVSRRFAMRAACSSHQYEK